MKSKHLLKVVYENFYKVYNKKLADRLGVVYTPNIIVRFMVESADWLCQKHFGRKLIDKNVEILEPAAGTGTFVTELIEYFRGQPTKLKQKYLEELHANEVAILPYYVANLNIEATFAKITGEYVEFPNLCFVDTLDSVEGLRRFAGHQEELFGALSQENYARIKRQNKRKISVVIGNPPYNANQVNENENNKNRKYPAIDRRIKNTYIANSTAVKTKRYDMYSRFFRWASDRIEENGIVAFITNRNFIDAREADGFRKSLMSEFSDIYVVDLGGDWKSKGHAGGGNVFGIGTGVAISFLIRHNGSAASHVKYTYRQESESADEKLSFLANTRIDEVNFEEITPDKNGNWFAAEAGEFLSFINIGDKETKSATAPSKESSVFKLFSLGVVTNRDEWVYDFDRDVVAEKMKYFVSVYNKEVRRTKGVVDPEALTAQIKWTRAVKRDLENEVIYDFDAGKIRPCLFRPFVRKNLYWDRRLNEMQYQLPLLFDPGKKNRAILISSGKRGMFTCLATDIVPSVDVFLPDACQVFGRYRLTSSGEWIDNITDVALDRFRDAYKNRKMREIRKDDIFSYTYGVLHDPIYREKFSANLREVFPRIPFYENFWKWVDWGSTLLRLHVGYESVDPWPLKRIDRIDKKSRASGLAPEAILKANETEDSIRLDSETTLVGVPKIVWTHRLGNRSALQWILDQYSEKTPKDETIREKFNVYSFLKQKEQVINLLVRVTRVSAETQGIVDEMRQLNAR